jgi:hypothetical protein
MDLLRQRWPQGSLGSRAACSHLDALARRAGLSEADRLAVRAVATVLPFRTNEYVVEQLIDWDAAPDDPIYRLVFPQPDMLPAADVREISGLLAREAPDGEVRAAAHAVRMRLNPRPAGQLALNIPEIADEPLPGVQHKYHETLLVFPKQGQTCQAYCAYCFRWAQFIDEPDLKMAIDDMTRVTGYLMAHPEVTSVLITGGDPMIMGAAVLRRYAEVAGQKVFALHMIQARDPALVGQPFFARFDPGAIWLSGLEPAFASRFPFDPCPGGDTPAVVPRRRRRGVAGVRQPGAGLPRLAEWGWQTGPA